ncbi:translation initiation factor IF-2 [uncultured Phascolarctobacterium sp.]|uniref:translation initiation factor IF-2 n=1 Tax=uncultured Phascolarctobacterium sp. TaxID=512296 RepID=UPI0025F84958|nr:translation initiation factor IF-2 [uncultured Phascolarctobacterium sp.]
MGNKRIYEVAKDYGKPVNEVIDLLKKNNIEKTNFSAADDKAMSVIRKAYDKKPEPPKPAKTEKRDVSRPAAPARPQDTAKRNDNNMNRNNGQRNMQQNQQQNQRNNNNAQQGRNENRQGGRNEGRPQQNRGGQQGNRQGGQGGRNEGRPQNRNGQQGGQGNRQGNRNGQQRQGGIFVGPKSQQGPSVHGESRAQVSGGRSEGRSSGRSEGARDNRQGGRNAGKNRKDNKPQIKGSYATRESRPNRSAGHQMPVNRGGKKPAPKQQQAPVEIVRPTYVEIGESINVQEFSKLIKREVNEVIKALFMLGVMVTINQDIDFDTAQLIGDNFGVEVGQKAPEEDPTEIPEVDDPPEKRVPRPPVITVMGHVDHGKTSLLDAIRKTNVTSREAGGITQHIGAYKVNYQGKQIVFLDTPGHEAFTAMRARGAQVTDVAILVVAADDGVMPQTIEAINHAKAAKVPIIVAINKIDRPGANPDHVKQQLAEHELIPEDWGGDTIMVPVSAHQKTGISDLLEMILLVAEMQELKANPNLPAHGTIIEAQLDKGRGPVATVLVQRGTLHIGDTIIAGTSYGKVRAMINDRGEKVKKALPSTPVEVLGLNDVPAAGDILDSTDEKTARGVAEKRIAKKKEEEIKLNSKVSLDDLFQRIKEGEIKELNIVVKADVQGTIEALKASLEKIKNDEVKVAVVHAGVGAITESDVMLASAANALIIGFNVRPDANARKAAETEKVDVRTYRVIYDAINDVEAAIKGMLAPKFKEVIQGRVEIRQMITISKLKIAGCYVVEGKVTNSSKVRVVRDGIVVHEGVIESLRRFKDDVKEVAQGFECGITLEKFSDLKEGDIFEVYDMEEIAVE